MAYKNSAIMSAQDIIVHLHRIDGKSYGVAALSYSTNRCSNAKNIQVYDTETNKPELIVSGTNWREVDAGMNAALSAVLMMISKYERRDNDVRAHRD